MMIQAGLYSAGSDPILDAAIESWPKLDAFLAEDEWDNTQASFQRLGACMVAKAEEHGAPATPDQLNGSVQNDPNSAK